EGDVLKAVRTLTPEQLGLRPGELALIAGGPPCQPYSKAAMWAASAWNGIKDERATPIDGLLGLVERFQPRALLLENVPGFVRGRHGVLDYLGTRLRAINERTGTKYVPQAAILDAADFGIPQRRERAIVIALRGGEWFEFPRPRFADLPLTAWDAIGNLRTA